MSEDTMLGTNEAYARVKRMMGQTNTGRIEYPSGSNMRGSGGREHHADGDMVGTENHACGDMVGSKKKNSSVGDVNSPPGRAGSMMKPHFGAPQPGINTGMRRNAISQAHAENHKLGDMVGRMAGRASNAVQKAGSSAGSAMQKAGNAAGSAMKSAAKAAPGAMRSAGNAMQKAGNSAGSAINSAAKATPGAMRSAGNSAGKAASGASRFATNLAKNATPRPMYRRGGRTENMHDED